MSNVRATRAYRSPLRRAQAQATRQRVFDAALGLFADRGYAATSIAGIARAAGVARETIYATFGSKRRILEELVAGPFTQGAGQQARAAWLDRAGDAAAQLDVLAESARQFWSTNRALVSVLRQGTGDSGLAEVWATRQRDRRHLFRAMLSSWPPGTLRSDLDLQRAVDLTFALTSADFFHLLVDEADWSTDAYRERLADLLRRTLLEPPRPA